VSGGSLAVTEGSADYASSLTDGSIVLACSISGGANAYALVIRSPLCALLGFSVLPLACHPAGAPRERVPDAAIAVDPSATAPSSSLAPLASPPASVAAPSVRPVDVAPLSAGKPGLCFVEITSLLSADIFRGVRRSPSRDAARARLSSKTRGEWDGRDHALTYLQCRYAVRMNGKPYTYEHVAGQGFGSRRDLDTKTCDTPMEKDKVADPHAGAYWGFDLVEVTP